VYRDRINKYYESSLQDITVYKCYQIVKIDQKEIKFETETKSLIKNDLRKSIYWIKILSK